MTNAVKHGAEGKRPNRLAGERSPYLLQHATNPVDWYPWGEEAFKKARERDVPIFLSIGYSTCHWCHVMERESFENDEVAAYLNEHFVSIKVDREERPDVDAIYMSAVQAMTGSGGWPLSVWITHDLEPFYGGTYFPPEDRFGRPGFMSLLQRISSAWTTQREKVIASGAQIAGSLGQAPAPLQSADLGPATLKKGSDLYRGSYDSVNGGFSRPPKFPRAHEISFLLRQQRRQGDRELLAMITHTLDSMAAGGLYDQLGGGFHRYSTDARWLVPHFEKMLYDQAIMAKAYLEAFQVTGNAGYVRTVREVFNYVQRDLQDRGGAFHSAEDADSEGEEGKFYVWKPAEIDAVLGPAAGRAFSAYYDVTGKGNFEHGTSILNVTRPVTAVAKELGTSPAALDEILASGRAKLFAAREKRIRPHLDDKVLADWNGLMISALAFGGAVLDEPDYIRAAEKAADFVLGTMQKDGRLLHRYRDGEAAVPAFLDDYAFFGMGLLDLYQATFDSRWLRESRRLAREAVRLFRDETDGAFRLVGTDGEKLIVETKEIYDGAIPSGNSVAAAWLLKLGQLTVDSEIQEMGRGILQAFGAQVNRHPPGFPYYLMALEFAAEPTREIVIAGNREAPGTKEMLRVLRARFMPDAVVALHEPGAGGEEIRALVPFIKEQVQRDGKPTAYVCRNYACERPTTDPKRLEQLLDARPAQAATSD
jgi:uncharacterized protein YyaL (SSP411 family)